MNSDPGENLNHRSLKINCLYQGINWRKPLIYSLLTLTGRPLHGRIKQFLDLETQPPEVLEALQQEKRERLLSHAIKNVPYYRKRIESSHFLNEKAVDLGAWSSIPVLTRKALQQHSKDLKSDDFQKRNAYERFTSGSTGRPAMVLQDKVYWDLNVANKLYYKFTLGGQEPGQPEIRLWSNIQDVLGTPKSVSERLKDWLYHRTEFHHLRMSETDMRRFADLWNTIRPGWVEAYATPLYAFAMFVKDNRIPLHRPSGIISTAETLYPSMKLRIEEALKAPVFNRYGSRETGDIACSCREGLGLHISSWNNFVEILDKDFNPVKPGVLGKVYVTNLNNYSMPLIRYEIGDIASWPEVSQCPCGRHTPLIGFIEGRSANVFKTRSGEFLSGAYFFRIVQSYLKRGYVAQLQVVQKDYERILVRFVPGPKKDWGDLKTIVTQKINAVLGEEFSIEWEPVDDIPPLKSGKHNLAMCEIP